MITVLGRSLHTAFHAHAHNDLTYGLTCLFSQEYVLVQSAHRVGLPGSVPGTPLSTAHGRVSKRWCRGLTTTSSGSCLILSFLTWAATCGCLPLTGKEP